MAERRTGPLFPFRARVRETGNDSVRYVSLPLVAAPALMCDRTALVPVEADGSHLTRVGVARRQHDIRREVFGPWCKSATSTASRRDWARAGSRVDDACHGLGRFEG